MVELLIYTTLWIWGVNFAFKPTQIFGSIGVKIESELSRWAYKPLIGCCACMSSIHGTIAFLLFAFPMHVSYWLYPVFIVCLVGINHIITAFIYDLD